MTDSRVAQESNTTPCKTCDGSGYVVVPVCCGRPDRILYGECCGSPDQHQDACPDCTGAA